MEAGSAEAKATPVKAEPSTPKAKAKSAPAKAKTSPAKAKTSPAKAKTSPAKAKTSTAKAKTGTTPARKAKPASAGSTGPRTPSGKGTTHRSLQSATAARPDGASRKPGATSQPRSAAPPPPEQAGALGTAVQAAAELTEIGLKASARALRGALTRLPRR